MPPYKPYASDAQSRKFFAMARRGEVSMAEAKGKAHATDYGHLPQRTGRQPASMRGLARFGVNARK